jgi:tRNA (cmo5U34)-methyltransferase
MGKVGEGISAENASWNFGGNTPKNFTNHVKRSVPFYEEGHNLIEKISDFFVYSDSVCYELGVSTGTLIRKLSIRHKKSVRWIGIDIESKMIEQASKEIKSSIGTLGNIELFVDDINSFSYEPTDLIISYYTMQFIHPKFRQELINNIYQNLNWGGAFILFEKVHGSDARFQDIFSSIYTEYKLDNGYSSEEIIEKARSLKGVLEPFSSQGNIDMLRRAGFVDITTIFQWVNFKGFLCIK